jgi:hypothetical protein
MQSNEISFAFTAPYGTKSDQEGSSEPHPDFNVETMQKFIIG